MPRTALPLFTIVLLSFRVVEGQQPALTIGGTTAGAGQLGSGYLEVPAGRDAGTRIPLTIVRGGTPGPTLALIAGTHGSEVAPILALQRVRGMLDARRLRGTVILVHVANLPSFLGQIGRAHV